MSLVMSIAVKFVVFSLLLFCLMFVLYSLIFFGFRFQKVLSRYWNRAPKEKLYAAFFSFFVANASFYFSLYFQVKKLLFLIFLAFVCYSFFFLSLFQYFQNLDEEVRREEGEG